MFSILIGLKKNLQIPCFVSLNNSVTLTPTQNQSFSPVWFYTKLLTNDEAFVQLMTQNIDRIMILMPMPQI